jgi:signal recognition particle GTPase
VSASAVGESNQTAIASDRILTAVPSQTPLVVLLARPNGAGKSTSAARLLEGALAVEEFVNKEHAA